MASFRLPQHLESSAQLRNVDAILRGFVFVIPYRIACTSSVKKLSTFEDDETGCICPAIKLKF